MARATPELEEDEEGPVAMWMGHELLRILMIVQLSEHSELARSAKGGSARRAWPLAGAAGYVVQGALVRHVTIMTSDRLFESRRRMIWI
jgi:hypothetical protein